MSITAHLHTVRVFPFSEQTSGVMRFDVVWCGVLWCAVVWCGVVWYINTEMDCRVCMK